MILVTGGMGFIGSALVKRLRNEGNKVIALDNMTRCRKDVYGRHGDVCHAEDVNAAAMMGVDEIIHLASINGTQNFYDQPYDVLNVALRGICNVLDACKAYDIRRLVLASSSVVYGNADLMTEDGPLRIPDPYNPFWCYAAGKIASEMAVLHCPFLDKALIFRPFNVYGPGMMPGHVVSDFIAQMEKKAEESPPLHFDIIGDGSDCRSFCYIDDLVDGVMVMREKGEHRHVYNIGRPAVTSIAELATEVARLFGHEDIVLNSVGEHKGNVQYRRPDVGKMQALGWEPQVTLQDGLRRTVDHERAN
jgi:nucleoside-diphosphate-sugar epimerase